MSFLKTDIDKTNHAYKTADSYLDRLTNLFTKVMDDVRKSPNFPENAQEILYKFYGDGSSDLSLLKRLGESYALTSKGVLKTLMIKKEGETKKLDVKTIGTREFFDADTSLRSFRAVRRRLMNIIRKYHIDINEEDYERLRVEKI